MRFKLSKFLEEVSQVLADKKGAETLLVEDAVTGGVLEFLDVHEAAYVLEDSGTMEDVEKVFDLSVKEFHQLLEEAA